jgi:PAS domain S-box-containing protein
MVTTYWRQPHEASVSELNALDILARLAADLIERMQAEQALRRVMEFDEAVMSNMGEGLYTVDVQGYVTSMNPAAGRLLGWTLEELHGRRMHDATHYKRPDGAPLPIEECAGFRAQREGKALTGYEDCFIRKDGTLFDVVYSSSPLREGENTTGLVVVFRDITEQKRAEEALRKSEAERKIILNHTPFLLTRCSRDLRYQFVSHAYARMLGRTQEEVAGKPIADVLGEAGFKTILPHIEKVLQGEPVEFEATVPLQGVGVRSFRTIYTPDRDAQGNVAGWIGSILDITDRKEAEEALRQSEKRLKNAERLANVGHWDWDLGSNHVLWSEGAFRIFGQPRDYKPSYEDLLRVTIPEDKERVDKVVRDSLAHKRGFVVEFQIARPDGDLRTVKSVSEISLDEERGLPVRMFGTVQDVTDEKRAQEESAARQKLESVGTLASGIAHDFNNLLGGVAAQSELGLVDCASGLLPAEELKAIRDAAVRGSEIVRQLMIYAGKENEAPGLVDLSKIVAEMVELLKVSVSKHVTLETDLRQDLPAVRASAAQLRQIVMNLVTNASEAIGDRDGVVRVTTGPVALGRAAARRKGLAEGDYLQLKVSDTGCGMAPETQARMFEPFFTTKAAGHGLGLAIVQGIVGSLKGAIQLTSEPGKGATFQILLPGAETAAEAAGGPMSGVQALVRPQQLTVLFVEDEDPLRQAVAKMLRRTGFEVLEAANGTAAIDALRANQSRIDLILLDTTIPGASSHEVVVEAARTRPDARVILTSAYSREMATAAFSDLHVEHFIRKPFDFDSLVNLLKGAPAPPTS